MSSPVYDPNTPIFPGQDLASTQPNFLDNFKVMADIFSVNHVSLTTSGTAGNHNKVDLVEQEQSPQTNVGQIANYTKLVEGQIDSSKIEAEHLFLRYQTGEEVQLTAFQIYSIKDVTGQTSYFTFLPGKILAYFGTITVVGNGLNSKGVLKLTPPIAKNIMTVSFCPSNNSNSFGGIKPHIKIPAQEEGVYKSIEVFGAGAFGSAPAVTYYYLVLANT